MYQEERAAHEEKDQVSGEAIKGASIAHLSAVMQGACAKPVFPHCNRHWKAPDMESTGWHNLLGLGGLMGPTPP